MNSKKPYLISDVNFMFAIINRYDEHHSIVTSIIESLKNQDTNLKYLLITSSKKIFMDTYTEKLRSAFLLILECFNRMKMKKIKDKIIFIEKFNRLLNNHIKRRKDLTNENFTKLVLSKYSVFDLQNREKLREALHYFQENLMLAKQQLDIFNNEIKHLIKIREPKNLALSNNKILELQKRNIEPYKTKFSVFRDEEDDLLIILEFLAWCYLEPKVSYFHMISGDDEMIKALKFLKRELNYSFSAINYKFKNEWKLYS